MPTQQFPDAQDVLSRVSDWEPFYQKHLGPPMQRRGQEIRYACVLHGGDGPNLSINTTDGLFCCHSGCQDQGGDYLKFLMRLKNIDFKEALAEAMQEIGVSPSDASATRRSAPRPKPAPKPRQAAPIRYLDPALAEKYHQALLKSPTTMAFLLETRGYSEDTIRHWKLGLVMRQDEDFWRVAFPVYDAEGRLINIRCHLPKWSDKYTDEQRKRLGKSKPIEGGLSTGLFPMSVISESAELTLAGGEPDCILGNQLGIPTITGTSGEGTLKPEWLPILKGKRINVLLDNDATGHGAALKACQKLVEAGADVYLASYPDGIKDLTEWYLQEGCTGGDLRRVLKAAQPFTGAEGKGAKRRALTDIGNGQRLVDQHGKDYRHVFEWDADLFWNGKCWQKDKTAEIMRRAKEVAVSVFQEAADCPDEGQQKEIAKHAVRSQSLRGLQAMIEMAKSELPIPVLVDQLDQNPWILACQNGTIDLKTGRLRPSRREDMGTRCLSVDYKPDQAAPTWEAFLAKIMPDPDVRAFLQRAVGYALTGDVSEQCLFFLHGGGGNGKSTLLLALLEIFGSYAKQSAPDLLIAKEHSGGPNIDVADLQGARLVATIEVEDGKRMAEGIVKQITGGDRVKARFMRQDYFEFAPTHKIFLSANHKPTVRGNDYAIWRRIKLIPFDVTITAEEKDPHLIDKLKAEASGILAWAVAGCLEWQRLGLNEPQAVTTATNAYRAEMDVLADFLTECCIRRTTLQITSSTLYAAYIQWCEKSAERPLGKKSFNTRLQEQSGICSAQNIGPSRSRGWQGLALRSDYPAENR